MKITVQLFFTGLCFTFFSLVASADNIIEEQFSCFGTEPFWGLKMAADDGRIYEAQFSVMGSESSAVQYKADALITQVSANTPSVFFVGSKDSNFSAFVERKSNMDPMCNDGMSDRLYPYLIHIKAGANIYSGCCSSNIYPYRDEYNHP
jgi:uncharacterized membrane protein